MTPAEELGELLSGYCSTECMYNLPVWKELGKMFKVVENFTEGLID